MRFSTTSFVTGQPRLLVFSTFARFALIFAMSLAAVGVALGQSGDTNLTPATTNKTTQPPKEKPLPFTLRVTTDQVIGISLKAKDIKLKEIAVELSRRLKVPVMVTPIMEKYLVTTDFSDLVIEPAMQLLAPQVYIDYEVDSGTGQPRPVGIFLHGYNERPPAENAVVRGNSDVMIIEGNTEDTGTESTNGDEDDLKVKYEKGTLTVKATKEPLVVVLYGIANELGIPLEVKNEVLDPVTVNIKNSSVESALQQLGPNIRLYVRADLQVQTRRPLRMVLVGPEKKS
jgi:hypothetical protein